MALRFAVASGVRGVGVASGVGLAVGVGEFSGVGDGEAVGEAVASSVGVAVAGSGVGGASVGEDVACAGVGTLVGGAAAGVHAPRSKTRVMRMAEMRMRLGGMVGSGSGCGVNSRDSIARGDDMLPSA